MKKMRNVKRILMISLLVGIIGFVMYQNKEWEYKSDEISNPLSQFDTITNLEILCNSDYFKYEPLEEEDYEETLALIEPALLDIYRDDNFWGGGFIYKITKDNVYCLSVSHIVKKMGNGCTITFFDNTKIKQNIRYIAVKGSTQVSMFKIPIKDIPMETLVNLREIHIDYDIYDKIDAGTNLVAFSKNFRNTNDDVIRNPVVYDKNSTSLETYCGSAYGGDTYIECKRVVRNGMSGTAITDYCGNLVGFVCCHYNGHDYYSKIYRIPELEARIHELD